MAGDVIDYVKYREGHSDLGDQTIVVELIGQASNITVRRMGGQPLFSIPWANFGSANEGVLFKRGADQLGAFVIASIPFLQLTKAGNQYRDGVYVDYWDEEIGRNQRVFFETGSEWKARRVVQKIYQYRDQYHRTLSQISKPTVRQKVETTKRLAAKSPTSKSSKTKSAIKPKPRTSTPKRSVQKRSKKK